MRNLSTGVAKLAKMSFFLIVALSLSFTVFAQKTITGKVSDNSGAPLVGASVVVKGTSNSSIGQRVPASPEKWIGCR
ncbi:MAG: hypothetical protein Q8943_19710, partial [Bacteroidota bacterium]|nr:hypothetical protein [Bacteroidota bacterium]